MNRLTFVQAALCLLVLMLPSPLTAQSTPNHTEVDWTAYIELVDTHLQRYPEMQPQDIYKLLFQATRGPGHFGMEYDFVFNYLTLESEKLDSARYQDTTLVEPLGPEYIRIYLGPFLARGGTLDSLATFQVASAEKPPESDLMPEVWDAFTHSHVVTELDSIQQAEIPKFTELMITNNWPAVHHSDLYRSLYDPHYRVLLRSKLSSISPK